MNLNLLQAPSNVVMIRPHRFYTNPETAADNNFQQAGAKSDEIAIKARNEFDRMVEQLTSEGVKVHCFDDFGQHDTPDSVFPNNWFSTHHGGRVAIYPMLSVNRRRERRSDVIEMLKCEYRVQEVVDYSGLELDGLYLEGTGAMVLDHVERVAYVARSGRADPILLERFCTTFGYEPMAFDAFDSTGHAIYHSNVMMSIATDFVLIGLDSIMDRKRRDEVACRLAAGRTVIPLFRNQISEFAGNALELTGQYGRILAISARAANCLTALQLKTIQSTAKLLPLDIPTIESAGGSVRCMLAGIHLTSRSMS